MNWFKELVLPTNASTLASNVDDLFVAITLISVFFFVLVAGLLAFFVMNYRRKKPTDVTPHITHNMTLEITWSVLPLLIVIGVFFWGFRDFLRANVAPGEAMEIQVTAKKWVWSFEYPDGTRTINELHVPVNKSVKLVMTSEDVLHSFFVPNFRVKHDVVPGRYTQVWFQATKLGPQQIFCTEYCGKGHSDMLAKVFVDDDAAYAKWLAEGDEFTRTAPLAEVGKLVYENKGCATCHSLDGTRGQGPSWKGVYGKMHKMTDGTDMMADENYIRESILEPQKHIVMGFEGIMPTFQGLLRERELRGVIEFIKKQK